MIKQKLIQVLAVLRTVLSVIFMAAFFYIAFSVLVDPLCLFLEKKVDFIYGLF